MSKFKVGDRVRPKFSCSGVEEGKIYTVKNGFKDGENSDQLAIWDEDSGNGCTCQSNWELIEEQKFNVGDVIVSSGDGVYSITTKSINFVGKVTKILDNGESILVKVIECDSITEIGTEYTIRSKYFELQTPKKTLIKGNMDIDEIKEFPKDVLVKAEKDAKKEIAEEQADVAKIAFKELLVKISDAEVEVKRAQKKLTDLRGKANITSPVVKRRGRPAKKK